LHANASSLTSVLPDTNASPCRRHPTPLRRGDLWRADAITDSAKQFRGAHCVVRCRMRCFGVPGNAGGLQRFAEHRLSIDNARECGGVEARERVEGAALGLRTLDGGVQE